MNPPAISWHGRERARPVWLPDSWGTAAAAFAAATVPSIVAIVLRWQGGDLPAQLFRADLVRRDGFTLWNNEWFGGHATMSYSVLSPLLGAIAGPIALGAISGIVSAVLFERILHSAFGRRALPAAIWFALATVTNLIVGRVTFALGVVLALGAIYALQRGHVVAAIVCGALGSLSSPVAGCFLVFALVAWACADHDRRRRLAAVIAGALLPLAAIGLLFPTPGFEPFLLWNFACNLALCAVVAFAGRRHPVVVAGAACYAIALVAAFVVPTPLGGNINRYAQYLAGPMLAVLLLPRRKVVLAAFAVPLIAWQWYPAIDGIAFAGADASTKPGFYAPLVHYLHSTSGPIGRVEIVPTSRHWEAAYAAPQMLLARGWERQLDIAYNPIFYETPLTADAYRQWLLANGVAFVALPDALLDASSLARDERALLERGVPGLHEVWRARHWQVWRVDGFHGLVDGPARLIGLAPDQMTLAVERPGDVVVRVRASGQWAVPDGACASATSDGWTVLRNLRPGTVVVSQSLAGTPCPV